MLTKYSSVTPKPFTGRLSRRVFKGTIFLLQKNCVLWSFK